MPIEFTQIAKPADSSDNSLFRLTMAYDGSGRRISKTRWVKKLGSQDWEKELVYGTEGNATSDPFRVSAPLAAYNYRAFGEMVELTPPPTGKVTENFTGKELDDEIALNYFVARYLDPMLGMWISVDAARQYDSPYTYVGNNPIIMMEILEDLLDKLLLVLVVVFF